MKRIMRSLPVLALVLAFASCTTGAVPRLPQVEQATEAFESGGERYRAHRACAATGRSVDDLTRCMQEAGWDFLARGPGYPEADCWQARDHGEVGGIPAQCFVRAAHAGGSPP
jgi:hypothetical protein